MATKKEKRAQALARREKFLAELARSNSEALRKEKSRRFQKSLDDWEDQHNKSHVRVSVKECPHCKIIKSANKRMEQERKEEIVRDAEKNFLTNPFSVASTSS